MSSLLKRGPAVQAPDKTPITLPRPWPDLLALGLLAAGTAAVLRAFWQPGLPPEADFLIGVYRSLSLDLAWHSRQFYPRLSMDLNFGYGGPLLQYYPPLVSYVMLVWHWLGLGWVEAGKATAAMMLWLGGIGSYLFARRLFHDRRAGFVSGAAYLFAPYLLYTVYERGAVAESAGLALLPWVFWGMQRVLEGVGRRAALPAAVLVALLVLAHNITALFALPALVVYLFWQAWPVRAWRQLRSAGLALALGLGLSGFYWLPALAERHYAQIERWMLLGESDILNNLQPLERVIGSGLAFDYWLSSVPALPQYQVVLGVLALLGLAWQGRRLRYQMVLLGLALLAALFLQLPASRPLWQAIPVLRFIQFSWRLYGLMSFCLALLLGSLLIVRPLAGRAGWLVAAAVLALVAYGSTARLVPIPPGRWLPFMSSQVSLADLNTRGKAGYQLFNDFQPAAMQTDTWELAGSGPLGDPGRPLSAAPAVRVVRDGPARFDLSVEAPAPFSLRLPRIFFPGWQITVAGHPVATYASGVFGLVTADLPAGSYAVVARFGETPLRAAADVIALLSLCGLVLAWAMAPRGWRMLAGVGLATALLAGLSLAHQGLGQPAVRPSAYAAALGDEVQLLGYALPRTTWHAGETIPVRLYWLALRRPAQDYVVFLHVVKPDDSARVGLSDHQPCLDLCPTTRWHAGQLVVDRQEVRLDPATPPGTYRLLAGMYQTDPVQNLPARPGPSIWPGDRLDLGEIEVK